MGSGSIGGNLARLFARAGHQVFVANSRGPESLKELIEEIGPNATAVTRGEAARDADVVVLATHWIRPEALPDPAAVAVAVAVADKIVIDPMSAYSPDGKPMELGDTTPSEETAAKRLPGARLVKAFNTIWFKHLAETGRTDLPLDERRAILLAGGDEAAKAVVSRLIKDIGFAPVDSGDHKHCGRRQGARSPVSAKEITGAEGRSASAGMGT
jgi:hypothetical protein